MQEFMFTAIGFILGSCFGITTMCLIQINRNKEYFMGKDGEKNEK